MHLVQLNIILETCSWIKDVLKFLLKSKVLRQSTNLPVTSKNPYYIINQTGQSRNRYQPEKSLISASLPNIVLLLETKMLIHFGQKSLVS